MVSSFAFSSMFIFHLLRSISSTAKWRIFLKFLFVLFLSIKQTKIFAHKRVTRYFLLLVWSTTVRFIGIDNDWSISEQVRFKMNWSDLYWESFRSRDQRMKEMLALSFFPARKYLQSVTWVSNHRWFSWNFQRRIRNTIEEIYEFHRIDV